MVNKIYTLILVMLFALPLAAQSPTVTIDHVTDVPGTVEVPVHFDNFAQNVGAITLNIGFDNQVLTFLEIEDELDGFWFTNHQGGELSISYIGNTDVNGEYITLIFEYSGFSSDLTFLPGNEIAYTDDTVQHGIVYVPGSVSMDETLAEGAVSLGTLEDVAVGEEIDMPVYMEGPGLEDVSSFTLEIHYDNDKLSFMSVHNIHEDLGAQYIVETSPGLIDIVWFGASIDMTDLTKILDIQFTFNGGGRYPP